MCVFAASHKAQTKLSINQLKIFDYLNPVFFSHMDIKKKEHWNK